MVDDIKEVAEQNYELGKIVAIEAIAQTRKNQAATYFSNNLDDRAKIYRDLANALLEEATTRRENYERKYHEDI